MVVTRRRMTFGRVSRFLDDSSMTTHQHTYRTYTKFALAVSAMSTFKRKKRRTIFHVDHFKKNLTDFSQ